MDTTTEQTIETYGNIRMKMDIEGDGYYFHSYTGPAKFEFDPELKEAFTQAATGIKTFQALLDKRITELGGDPDEFEV